jgi:hypothetical protein
VEGKGARSQLKMSDGTLTRVLAFAKNHASGSELVEDKIFSLDFDLFS